MHVTWIGGWGVTPESLQPLAEMYFPSAEHDFHGSTSLALREVLEGGDPPPLFAETKVNGSMPKRQWGGAGQNAGADILIGWSLGAWRVLEAASCGARFSGKVLLLAPFVAFPAEAQLGGKCSRTQVKFLRRWLQREPLAALADFYQRAGLVNPPAELPYDLPDLLEGLDRLGEDASPVVCEFAARGLPSNWQAFVGDCDPLLDGTAVCQSLPGCKLVPGASHAIADLLATSQA